MKTATVLVLLPLASFALQGCGDPGELAETDLLADQLDVGSEAITVGSWTPWISEETPAALCDGNSAASGIAVSGSFSDNISLFCHSGLAVDFGNSYWTGWFSEESPGVLKCKPGNFVVTGLQCSGRFCDNMRFECSKLVTRSLSGGFATEGRVSTASNGVRSFVGTGVVFVGLGCSSPGRFCETVMYQYSGLK